jgi:hypothetical protein
MSNTKQRWNDTDRGKQKKKNCPSATLSTTNPTWLDLGAKPMTNRMSYGTAITLGYNVYALLTPTSSSNKHRTGWSCPPERPTYKNCSNDFHALKYYFIKAAVSYAYDNPRWAPFTRRPGSPFCQNKLICLWEWPRNMDTRNRKRIFRFDISNISF